jgi:hypothetical protein
MTANPFVEMPVNDDWTYARMNIRFSTRRLQVPFILHATINVAGPAPQSMRRQVVGDVNHGNLLASFPGAPAIAKRISSSVWTWVGTPRTKTISCRSPTGPAPAPFSFPPAQFTVGFYEDVRVFGLSDSWPPSCDPDAFRRQDSLVYGLRIVERVRYKWAWKSRNGNTFAMIWLP